MLQDCRCFREWRGGKSKQDFTLRMYEQKHWLFQKDQGKMHHIKTTADAGIQSIYMRQCEIVWSGRYDVRFLGQKVSFEQENLQSRLHWTAT